MAHTLVEIRYKQSDCRNKTDCAKIVLLWLMYVGVILFRSYELVHGGIINYF